MTDDTARDLEQAEAKFAEEQRKFNEAARAFLARIAGDFPARADDFAKKAALKAPAAAQALGPAGTAKLREQIAVVARELGDSLEVDDIPWPVGGTESRTIHDALFKAMYGNTYLSKLNSLLKEAGFIGTHGGMLPQSLYDQTDFQDIESALPPFKTAIHERAAAAKAVQRATIESMWD